ncbi:MAG: hypothetical protein M3Z67_06820 [Commensalibacter sp.]|nr:hypothetical protein [Commensalibacter sp.]
MDYILGCLLHLQIASSPDSSENSSLTQSVDISAMTSTQKVKMGMAAAFKKLPWTIGQDLIDQLTPENIAMMALFIGLAGGG